MDSWGVVRVWVTTIVLLTGVLSVSSTSIRNQQDSRVLSKCTVKKASGVCTNRKSHHCSDGKFYAGKCPGPENVQCCIRPAPTCQVGESHGTCTDTREACDYRLELICPSTCNFAVCDCDDMFLRITKGTDAPYNATYDTSQPCTCDPFFIRFTFSDDECCDGATPASMIGVEITE